MKIELIIPDHRPVISELDALDPEKARLRAVWRILDAIVFASVNRTCLVDGVDSILSDDEPFGGAYNDLQRENEELRDEIDDLRERLTAAERAA